MPKLMSAPIVDYTSDGSVSDYHKLLALTMMADAKPSKPLMVRSTQKLSVKKKGIVTIVMIKFIRRMVRRRPQFVKNFDRRAPHVRPKTAVDEIMVLFRSVSSPQLS